MTPIFWCLLEFTNFEEFLLAILAEAIYSLVCTFNLFSRLVPYVELSDSVDQSKALPALSLLDQEAQLRTLAS